LTLSVNLYIVSGAVRRAGSKRSATIHEVAEVAGMSIATVSRAFHTPEMVKPQTRERVLEAAAGLGYTPNRAARGLITGRTGNLGLIVPDIANPFFPALVKAAQGRARAGDYAVFIADTDEDPHTEEQVIRALAKQVDGVIACSSRMSDAKLRGLASVTTVVLVNRRSGAIPAVVMDMTGGMRQAVEHLHALGHRSAVFLAGPRASWSNRQRRGALRATADRLGMKVTELGPFEPGYDAGVHAADLALAEKPSAIVAYNDLMALGVLGRLSDRGVAVPGDVSVVGFDDIQMAALAAPALTTVAVPTATAGRAAVDMLLDALAERTGNGRQAHALRCELMVRASTGPAPRGSRSAARSGARRRTAPARATRED
jgi:DNA-binding LacI/PurR family transcriptional regulator